jgi:site-specific DNA-methyltransferase (adenine-specific)
MKIDLYHGDCLEVMKSIPDGSIDLTVTSPPYDNLRTYNGYTFDFEGIAQELYRLTKDGGVVVWIVGDATVKGSETGTSFRQALYFMECGFNLHDTMIYQKNNFSNPSSNRYHQIFEYMFVFSKQKPKTFNCIKDRKNVCAGQSNWGINKSRQKNGSFKERPKKIVSEFGMRYNIWEFMTSKGFATKDEIAYKHPATFPEQLAKDHIISWSNEGDTVLDCFMGSGTTGKMVKQLNRNFIGIEISEEYLQIAKQRINDTEIKQQSTKPVDYDHQGDCV